MRSSDDLLSLRSCISLVRLFHQRIKEPIAATPQTLKCDPALALIYSQRLLALAQEAADAANGTTDVLLSRLAMTLEEIGEWLAAHAHGDVASAADVLGDRFYLLLGDAVATGLPLSEIFTAVHDSNILRLAGVATGLGKGVKGAGYQRPDLATLLATLAAGRSADETDSLLNEELACEFQQGLLRFDECSSVLIHIPQSAEFDEFDERSVTEHDIDQIERQRSHPGSP